LTGNALIRRPADARSVPRATVAPKSRRGKFRSQILGPVRSPDPPLPAAPSSRSPRPPHCPRLRLRLLAGPARSSTGTRSGPPVPWESTPSGSRSRRAPSPTPPRHSQDTPSPPPKSNPVKPNRPDFSPQPHRRGAPCSLLPANIPIASPSRSHNNPPRTRTKPI
jgi:hypothetical protein